MSFNEAYSGILPETSKNLPDILLDRLPVACGCFDAEGNLIAANKQWLSLFGMENVADFFAVLPDSQDCAKSTKEFIFEHIQTARKKDDYQFRLFTERQDEHLACLDITLRCEATGLTIACAHEISCHKDGLDALMAKTQEVDEVNEILINSAPVIIMVWDTSFNLVATSDQAMKTFGLKNKLEYIERFHELSPEIQPCGTPSKEKSRHALKMALEHGYNRFEWMHQTIDGEPVPSEVTLVRFKRGDTYMLVAYANDLRPVKAAMQTVQNSYEMVQGFIDSAPFFIEIWDDKFNLIDCNLTVLKVFGLSSKEEYMEIVFNKLSPERQPCGTPSAAKAASLVKAAFDEGYSRSEWMHIDLDGNPLPVELTMVRLKREGEDIVVSYNRDLREINAAMKKVQNSYEEIKEFIDSAPLFIEIWDDNFNLIDCNSAAAKMFDLSSTEEYTKIFNELSPEYQPCGTLSAEKIISVIKTAFKEGYHRTDWMHITPEGKPLPVSVTYVRLKREGKDIVVGYNRDMREINAAMNKVQESYEMAKQFIDSAPFFIEIWNDHYKLVECNQTAAKMFHLANTEEYMKIFDELSPEYQPCGTPSAEKIITLIKTAFREGYLHTEWMHITPDGQPLPVEVTYVRLKREDKDIVVGYNRDMREAKLREMAEDANKAKSSFLNTMSHEIRTPMNAILGITEIQLMNQSLEPEIKESFERIYISGDLLLSIINDILDLSKIEAGKLDIVIKKYEIASFASDTAQLNMMRIASKPIEFNLLVNEDVPSYMLGDELRIKQIMNNLLSNAFKYTEKGEVTLSITHERSKTNDKELSLIFTVSDTGRGMTKEQVSQLFDEYSRFNEEANRSTEGTGLGMSITRNLVNLMDGEIFVESEPGKGSSFTVRLPQGDAGSEVLGKEAAQQLREFRTHNRSQMKRVQISRESMPYGRVLIVDDVETNIYVARGLLVPYELQIDWAYSGFAAIEKVEKGNEYDIIFMDHMMPEMDGMETTKRLRKMGYNHPIVALTANVLSGQAEVFLQNGFDDFISKPIDIRQLNYVLNKLVRDKQPEAVIQEVRQRKSAEKAVAIKTPLQHISPEFAEIFARDARKSIDAIETLLKKGDISNKDLRTYIIHVHGMKSILASFNNLELSAVAGRLEQMGREEKLRIIAAETPAFLHKLKTFVNKITEGKNKSGNLDAPMEDKAEDKSYLREKLLAIKTACGDYNEVTAEEVLKELKGKSWSQPTKELLDTISHYLLRSDFDEAVDAVDKFLG